MGCVHIPSVRIEEPTFVDRSANHEEPTSVKTETSFSTFQTSYKTLRHY
jgi:hypothetical protein